jgi:hypothetical protein
MNKYFSDEELLILKNLSIADQFEKLGNLQKIKALYGIDMKPETEKVYEDYHEKIQMIIFKLDKMIGPS